MVARRPHTVWVRPSQDTLEGENVVDLDHTEGRLIRCNVQPDTPQRAFEATGINIDSPFRVLMNMCDAEGLRDGGELDFGGRVLRIRGDVILRKQGLSTDHAKLYAEEVRL
jgi:hypothetical protein